VPREAGDLVSVRFQEMTLIVKNLVLAAGLLVKIMALKDFQDACS
jgi:hypothetical protein